MPMQSVRRKTPTSGETGRVMLLLILQTTVFLTSAVWARPECDVETNGRCWGSMRCDVSAGGWIMSGTSKQNCCYDYQCNMAAVDNGSPMRSVRGAQDMLLETVSGMIITPL